MSGNGVRNLLNDVRHGCGDNSILRQLHESRIMGKYIPVIKIPGMSRSRKLLLPTMRANIKAGSNQLYKSVIWLPMAVAKVIAIPAFANFPGEIG
jgi:hypothetical protein